MKNVVFWDLRRVALAKTDVSKEPSVSIVKVRRIGESLRSMRRLLITANFLPSSQIFLTLMMEALVSSETSILTRTTRRDIPEDAILQVLTLICCLLYPPV
jgi:hypothetical protein